MHSLEVIYVDSVTKFNPTILTDILDWVYIFVIIIVLLLYERQEREREILGGILLHMSQILRLSAMYR